MNAGNPRRILAALCLGSLSIAAFSQTSQIALPSPAKVVPPTQAVIHYGQLPLSFESNRGQTSSNVQWLARGPEYTLYFAGTDAVLEMNKIVPAKRGATNPAERKPNVSSSVVRMSLLGASASQQTTGENLQSGKANYFTGRDPAKWQHDVPMYGKVHMQGVYPGVDLLYYGHRGQLEYDFVVAPGADASAIRMRFDGAKAILAANGDLVLPMKGGGPEVRFNKPVVYQMKYGARQPVEGSFAIAANKQQVSFQLGAYDHSRRLVIDPTLLFLGVLGTGSVGTVPNGMTVDSLGELILTGYTRDLDFPVTSGALQTGCQTYSTVAATNGYTRCGPNNGASTSAFVTKMSADGTSLVYSTYLHGGGGAESGQSVATDAAGNAYVLGATSSNDFPITADAFEIYCGPYYPMRGVSGGDPSDFYPEASSCDSTAGGFYGVSGPILFIAKLNPTGSALLYSTFFGGSAAVYPVAIALDSANNIYFSGMVTDAFAASNIYPQNSHVPFPVTASAYQSYGVEMDTATLSKLSADGHTLLYSTLLGTLNATTFGASTQPLALAVGPNGIAYLGGETEAANFPVTAGVVKGSCVPGGNPGNCARYTAFLSAFDTTQTGSGSLLYSTYIGGTELAGANEVEQQVQGLAADSSNNVYVTGYTQAPDFPTTAGAYQTACNVASNSGLCQVAFLSKINPTGTAYVWSTFYGGDNTNQSANGEAVALDGSGRVYLYGQSRFGGGDFVNPIEPYHGGDKLFIAAFSSDGKQLEFGTHVGNASPTENENDEPIPSNGLFVDASGNMYFVGYAADGGALAGTPGTYANTAAGGGNRAFFGKISPLLEPTTTTLVISPFTATTGQTVTFTATVAGTIASTPAPTGTVTLVNTSTTPATTLDTITLGANGSGTYTTSSLAVGSYSVTAAYYADATYDVSTSSAQTLTISAAASQTIAFSALPGVTYGASVIALGATASSGLPVSYTVTGPATLAGSALTVTGAGSVTVTANQAGNNVYAGATSVSQSFTVGKAVLTVTANNASRAYGAANPTFGYTITGFVRSDTSAVVSGTATETTTATSTSTAGAYPITFSTESLTASNYTFTYVNGTLTVSGGAAQTITFGSLPNVTYGVSPITLTATASSGLPVSYASPTPAACKVSGSKATVIAPGTCTIQATQAGNQTYSAATPVSHSFTVLSASAYFTITPLPAAETVDRGVIGVFILQLSSVNGFAGSVTLSCSGGPAGSKCTDFPMTVKLKGTAYGLSGILFPRNATPGTYVITFTGVSGSLIRSATAKFTVK